MPLFFQPVLPFGKSMGTPIHEFPFLFLYPQSIMKANVFNTISGFFTILYNSRLIRTILILALLFIGRQSVSAQHHDCGAAFKGSPALYQIAYGQSAQISILNEMGGVANWRIQPTNGVSETSGTGNYTQAIKFAEPGRYEVIFTLADHTTTAVVEVSGVQMKFDTKSVVLSKPIRKGIPTDGTELTIQVELTTTDKKPIEYNATRNSSTGVSGIVVTSEAVKLKNGVQTITFHLSGTPQYSGTAQLGFFNLLGEGFFYNLLIAE